MHILGRMLMRQVHSTLVEATAGLRDRMWAPSLRDEMLRLSASTSVVGVMMMTAKVETVLSASFLKRRLHRIR